ncbi:MAG: tRNA-specific adenosine deaminase [Chlamydiae bacterium RIFCSPHIGHO2_12_FULL_44_59]|nr:MAG: tRNA-specific adenosine deaminase [Chlamydiae bacterium RIFCSPHIGHO2_01_FULL_44_39]OGN57958.1 MAG: tRNA-specific adenosine deaminase [Chlamydiae bacterium RIFCSPHIGHO2_02_FULL_45_9]OGN60696.1 MAG: tRNA-specific adenosine deaminase [Chlamydiae bacterium RIFCSPHIGHO2_12_FULL_44_59]OGN66956.1 MAG: tRNA-specific adenosine deaminase [Chlamydiae bacterium RIFCSPLOWO2_01_FULL_44_52]OGN67507.1 MAG: tRNA-specific adenosine deaminase [Chlamydiae bacterium RIFCSPLOWO2_02_FULL_45_22]OGN71209.1 MAG
MMLERDELFMKEALKEAKRAFDAGEVPVGAVLVHQNRVIARGHNQVELLQDATAHAEVLCLSAGSQALSNWRLVETTLYCTLEPCPMCAGALLSARVTRLVWGAPDLRLGANGSWVDLLTMRHPMHAVSVTSRVLEAEAADLMRTFFQKQRHKSRPFA